MDQRQDEDTNSGTEEESELEISRRKFLSWSKYVPPAIMTVLVSSQPVEAASPCTPDETCGPDDSCGPDF